MRTAILVASMGLLGLLALCLLPTDSAPSANAPRSSDRAPAAVAQPQSAPPASDLLPQRSPVADPGHCRILVRDAKGASLQGAEVCGARALRRHYASSELTLLGRTDRSGALDVPSTALLPVVLAFEEGYQPASASTERTDTAEIVLTLYAGAEVEVHCATRDGHPLAGVSVLFSTGVIDPTAAPPDASLRAGGDPRTAIHHGVTDASGHLLLHALPIGPVRAWVQHGGFALVGGWPKGDIVLGADRNRFDLRFDPVYGALAVVNGDEALTWRAEAPPELWIPPMAGHSLEIHRHRLAESSHATICFLACPRLVPGQGYQKVPPRMPVRILLEQRGWHDVDVDLQPLVSLLVPQVVEVKGKPPGDTGAVILHVLGPSGGRHGFEHLLLSRDSDVQTIRVPVSQLVRLPAASYAVSAPGAFAAAAIRGQEVSVEAGPAREVTLRLANDLAPVRFALTDEAGLTLTAGIVQIRALDRLETRVFEYGMDQSVFWVPQGDILVKVTAPGCKATEFAVAIPEPGTDPMVIARELARTPR